MMSLRRPGAILIVLLACGSPTALAAAPSFPALTGRVVDNADIIPAAAESALDGKLAALETQTTDQFVVVTLPSLQGYDIADYGYQLGRHWAVGQKDKDNGVLLIVAPSERAVRIEVGYGLEGDLTDAVTRLIIENAIIPKFREGDMAAGIVAGVDDVIKVLTGEAAQFKERAEKEAEQGDNDLVFVAIFLAVWVTLILLAHLRRRKGKWVWVAGSGSGSGWSGSSRGWSSGGSSGGFSGGGGSFGGGGSSGRW